MQDTVDLQEQQLENWSPSSADAAGQKLLVSLSCACLADSPGKYVHGGDESSSLLLDDLLRQVRRELVDVWENAVGDGDWDMDVVAVNPEHEGMSLGWLRMQTSEFEAVVYVAGTLVPFGVLISSQFQSRLYGRTGLAFFPSTQNGNIPEYHRRLLTLTSPHPPVVSGQQMQDRDEAVLVLCHRLVHNHRCQIYGGFVRDWVMRARPCKDIDCLADGPSTVYQGLVHWAQSSWSRQLQISLKQSKKGSTHLVLDVLFLSTMERFEVDLVSPGSYDGSVDVSCNNLKILHPAGLALKVENQSTPDLPSTVRMCLRQEFIPIRPISGQYDWDRILKRLREGWTCINSQQIPRHFLDSIRGTDLAQRCRP